MRASGAAAEGIKGKTCGTQPAILVPFNLWCFPATRRRIFYCFLSLSISTTQTKPSKPFCVFRFPFTGVQAPRVFDRRSPLLSNRATKDRLRTCSECLGANSKHFEAFGDGPGVHNPMVIAGGRGHPETEEKMRHLSRNPNE